MQEKSTSSNPVTATEMITSSRKKAATANWVLLQAREPAMEAAIDDIERHKEY